jgi:hypothetical protein
MRRVRQLAKYFADRIVKHRGDKEGSVERAGVLLFYQEWAFRPGIDFSNIARSHKIDIPNDMP